MTNQDLQNLISICEGIDHSIVQDESEVDGVHILAKVRGPAFFPDQVSGNDVHYPKEAWLNAINEPRFVKKLGDRLVFGTIGHDQVIDDSALKEGLVSHIITNVWIEESTNVGWAEYLVLGTETGKILNTVLRARSKLRVSTKAKGLFINKAGSKSVNPKVFFLERIDFVIDPGFDAALPELIESLNNIINQHETKIPMDKSNESADRLIQFLESQTEDLQKEKEELKDKLNKVENELKEVTESEETKTEELEKKVEELEKEVEELQESLKAYSALGTPSQIDEALTLGHSTITRLDTRLKQSLKDVAESLMADDDRAELAKYREWGSLKDLRDLAEASNKLADDYISTKLAGLKKEYPVCESLIDKLHSKGLSLSDIEEAVAVAKPVSTAGHRQSSKDFRKSSVSDINESKKPAAYGDTSKSLAHRLLKV